MLRRLRQLPVKRDVNDIETFINRELIPFLLELTQQVTDEDGNVLADALQGFPSFEAVDGEDGFQGPPGQPGATGAQGRPGSDAIDGEDGLDGRPGFEGKRGPQGDRGPIDIPTDGEDGYPGPPGPPGTTGRQGDRGADAVAEDGLDGHPGPPGPQGAAGRQGDSGSDGLDGEDGLDGRPGANGLQGPQGIPGPPGPPGIDGEDGLPGPAGPEVLDGDKGDITVTSGFWRVDVDINKAWTGTHSFTSPSFTVDTTGDINFDTDDDFTVGASGSVELAAGEDASGTLSNGVASIRGTGDVLLRGGGVGIFTGSLAAPVTDVGGGDIVLNATGGIGIICDPFAASPTTGLTNGFVTVQALHDISLFTTSGGIGIATDTSLVSGIDGAVSNGLIRLAATNGIQLATGAGVIYGQTPGDLWFSTTAGGLHLNTLNAGHPTSVSDGVILLTAQQLIHMNTKTSFVVTTNDVERLEVVSTGAWQLAGNTGSIGQFPMSAGASAPPDWQYPSSPSPQTRRLTGGYEVIKADGSRLVLDYVMDEEFLSAAADGATDANSKLGKYHWSTLVSESPFAMISDSGALHPGIARLTAGNTSPVQVTCNTRVNMADVAYLRCIVRLTGAVSGTNVRAACGLFDDIAEAEISSDTPDWGGNGLALFIATQTTTTGVWQVRDENASSGTNDSTGVTGVSGNWVDIELVNEGSGNWSYTVNGVANSTSGVTTTADVVPGFYVICAASPGGDVFFDVDKLVVGLRFANNRYT